MNAHVKKILRSARDQCNHFQPAICPYNPDQRSPGTTDVMFAFFQKLKKGSSGRSFETNLVLNQNPGLVSLTTVGWRRC
jgi:hypothetical protein